LTAALEGTKLHSALPHTDDQPPPLSIARRMPAIILVELVPAGGEEAALPAPPPRASVPPAPQRQQDPPVDKLLETTLSRPLFSSTRRPPQSAADDGNADTNLSDKRLTGIVITPDRHIAIFAVNDAKPLTLSEGESVSGWRIETIGPIEVSLSSPSGNKILRPQPDPNHAQSTGPAATTIAAPRNPPIIPNVSGVPSSRLRIPMKSPGQSEIMSPGSTK
jgi:hypothetical protein